MVRTAFEKDRGLILVHVQLIGKESIVIKMALDTGARYTIIPHEVAEKIGCIPEKDAKKFEIITGSGCEEVLAVAIPHFATLGKELKDFEVLIHDLPKGSYFDGVLGLDFLQKFSLKVDFKKGYIDLTGRARYD